MMMNLHTPSSNPASALLPTAAPQAPPASTTAAPNPGQASFARLLQHNRPPAQTVAPVPAKAPTVGVRSADSAARPSPAETPANTAVSARPAPPARGRDATARSTPASHVASKSAELKDDAAATRTRSDETDDTRAAATDPALADWLAGLNLPVPALPVADTTAVDATGTNAAPPTANAATAAAEAATAAAAAAAATAAGSAALGALGARAVGAKTEAGTDPAKPGAERDRHINTALRSIPREGVETALPAAVTARDSHGGQPGSGDSSDRGSAAPAWTPISTAPAVTPSTAGFMPIGLSTLVPQADTRAASAAPVPLSLPMPITSPEFPQALGAQLAVLAQGGVERAELHLNPAEMGPVSVQIAIEGTQARIDFGADVAATRQAIEAGLPELASALREAGLTLTGGGVSQHSRSHQGMADAQASSGSRGNGRDDGHAAVGDTPAPLRRVVRAGGIDAYA